MSLEFTKIINDIQQMGRYLAYRDREELVVKAIRLLQEKGSDPALVRERIRQVRESDVSGYRGAAPLVDGTPTDTPFHEMIPAPPTPEAGVLIAADGSQIYPDYNASSLYYLLNIGVLVYYHGTDTRPDQETLPSVHYRDVDLLDELKQVVSNRTVNSRRTMLEIRTLWQQSSRYRGSGVPAIALHDGNLLKFFGGNDITDSGSLIRDYMGLLVALHDQQTLLVGYVDNPRSSYLIGLLHLLDLEPHMVSEATLRTDGDLEGLTDATVFERLLKPGQRSAVMVQNSPTNLEYKRFNPSHEIAVCYVNVSDTKTPHIARLDMPMWVAREPAAVDTLHGLLLAQCRMQGMRPYPYALTRADELAYISGREKEQVERLVRRELMKNNVTSQTGSAKADSKDFARDIYKTDHRLGG